MKILAGIYLRISFVFEFKTNKQIEGKLGKVGIFGNFARGGENVKTIKN